MTSPASASFPWPQVPEPPPGEFRAGTLPGAGEGAGYLAARGARPGPALLVLASADSGYPAVHGLLRLADVLDAHRLAGAMLLTLTGTRQTAHPGELLEPADALVVALGSRPGWRRLTQAGYPATGRDAIDQPAARVAAVSGAAYWFSTPLSDDEADPAAVVARRGGVALGWLTPDSPEERAAAAEAVFQGAINILRGLGMLEGQILEPASLRVRHPVEAVAPVSGLWTPAVRLGQRVRIDDRLGSFRDASGNELGDLLTNVAGIVLGFSSAVWVDAGDPLVELARPLA